MKKRLLCVTVGMILAMSGCSAKENTAPEADASTETDTTIQEQESTETAEQTSPANPWKDITAEEASAYYDNLFTAPENATNAQWSVLEAETDSQPLVQLTFDLNTESGSMPFTARAKQVQDSDEDISGLYYEWDATFEQSLTYGVAQVLDVTAYRVLDDDQVVDLCTWYNADNNIAYSLSTHASDLDGFDITAVVLQMLPADSVDSIDSEQENSFVTTDISGCDTFTQIVDKLNDGQGYANANVDGVDVLLVSSGTFENEENFYAAIDAEVFCYDENGVPAFMGTVCSGGTAYPLAISDGKLLSGSNRSIVKSAILDSKIVPFEAFIVEYDEDGNATYDYISDEDYSDLSQDQLQSLYEDLIEEYLNAEVIEFTTVVK